jgi:hypothetical protein
MGRATGVSVPISSEGTGSTTTSATPREFRGEPSALRHLPRKMSRARASVVQVSECVDGVAQWLTRQEHRGREDVSKLATQVT